MKTIVTHYAPDVDAISSVWLIKRFLNGWADANLAFVSAGKTLNNDMVDCDPEILHVDTGMGILDHHQTDEDTCAARRVLEYLVDHRDEVRGHHFPDEALVRMVDVINDIDHFREVYYPRPEADFYDFGFVAMLDGLKLLHPDDHVKLVEFGMMALDGIFKQFQNKVWAEEEIQKIGVVFDSPWGKGIGMETVNDEALRIAQRNGYMVAIRKDPKKGFVRMKALPDSAADFTDTWKRLKEKDPHATWFLHASKKMILNGSMKNPESHPSTLTLGEIIDVLRINPKKDAVIKKKNKTK
jgi:hypothetical protein